MCLASGRGRILATSPCDRARGSQRSPPEPTVSDTLENSVCSKRPPTAGCSSMERQSIDRAWKKRCAGLGACSGQCGAWSDRHVPCRGRWFVPASPRRAYAGSLSVYQADPMGPFRVKGTAAPEVKFLDRCKTRGSEGVLQGRVRRSRMRVWGAKMIRHRRSPAL